jgi:acyl-[acyl-carrier-protein]-phospholipid O-acyltransferase/long-chain-fatty-acid--[acyl-carrier-protein] ligase
MIVSVGAVELAANQLLGAHYLAMAGAVFVAPFLLLAGYAGQIADRFSKTRVLQITKSFEIVIMVAGMAALASRNLEMLLVVLFLLAVQANFFSPAKYGILPEIVDEAQITRANGLLELSTFAAIVLGSSVGSLLFARWKGEPLLLGGTLLGIAVAGSLTSLFLRKVPASGSSERFHWNPFSEVWMGVRRIHSQRPLWLTTLGISYFWFLGALFQMAVILVGSESLHLSESRTGLLVTALAVGIGLGSLAAGWLSGDGIEIGLVPCGAAFLGACALLMGTAHSFASMVAWLAGAGFAGGLFIVPLNAFLQEQAAKQEKGRLLATNNFLNMIGVVLASGALYLLHDVLRWSAAQILAGAGVLTLGATVYIAWLAPAALARLAVWCCANILFKIRVVGAHNIPRTGGALIVSNHVSYADAILLGCTTPRLIRFLMWQPIFENRWLNPFCRLFRAIPLATHSPKESLRALRNARTVLEAGELVGIFPEGELTRTSHVKPFERGVELITRGLPSAPVIPVYLDGLWGHALSLKGGKVFGTSRLRLRHEVTIYVGEPMTGSVDAEQLYQKVLELGRAAAEYSKKPTTTLAHRFIKSAKQNWSAPAIADSTGKQLRFGETLTAALLLKSWLEEHADQRCIGLLFPASVAGALANLGVTLAGKTAVNLNFTAGVEAMQHAIRTCEIQTVLSSRVFYEKARLPELPGVVFLEDLYPGFTRRAKLRAALSARFSPARWLSGAAKPDDPAAVIFSSGSTGTPKGVMLSHWNLVANVEAVAQVYSVGSSDCMLGALPFFHSFGYTYTLWLPMLEGFKSVFHPNPTDAQAIGDLSGAHHPTLFLSTPTFCLGYLRKCTREQFASIRYLLVGAERLRPALADAFHKKFGVTPLEGYGCTEMGPAVSVNTACGESSGYRAGSVGRLLPRVAVRIVDPETFGPRAAGETGLLLVDGPSRMLGYIGERDRTTQALHDGYYVTGDLAYVDEQGFLHIVDRLARFCKIAGEMVPHIKVEEALAGILKGDRCLVTGIPDERRGERLAVLYEGDRATPAEMIQYLQAEGLPALWIPKRDHFCRVETLPQLGSGKVDLMKARAIAAQSTERQSLETVEAQ